MKIYTKTGDKGDTSLFGGQRVPKDALRIEAYGTIDELNSVLGIVLADMKQPEISRILLAVQHQLFELGADLATPRMIENDTMRRIGKADSLILEEHIDSIESSLSPIQNFILPGGSPAAARLQFARTVCRRAERTAVRLSRNEDIGPDLTIYLNRLSDLLFVLSRYANKVAGLSETYWQGNRT